jgi:hypothetical protein
MMGHQIWQLGFQQIGEQWVGKVDLENEGQIGKEPQIG